MRRQSDGEPNPFDQPLNLSYRLDEASPVRAEPNGIRERGMKVISKFEYTAYGPEDRFSHAAAQHEEYFQESGFLCWYDERQKIGGVWRIGNEPNLKGGGAAIWSNLVTPDHALFHRTDRLNEPQQAAERGWTAGSALAFEYDADDERISHWSMREDRAKAELIAEDLHRPVALFPNTGSKVKEKQAKQHLEVGVKVCGWAELDGKMYEVDGYGYRDHSWGQRHWLAIAGHRWLTGTLGDSHTFAMTSFLHDDGSVFQHGYLCDYKRGLIEYTDEIDILVHTEIDCVGHRGGTAAMRMRDGTVHRFAFEPHTKAVLSYYGGVACLDVPCRVRCGDLTGFADFETSTNPHRGLEAPFDRLRSTVVRNGLYRGDDLKRNAL